MFSEFPLFVFTTCGGLSAGLAIASALFPSKGEAKRPWLVPLVCLVLLCVGLLGVLFHLERPERFIFGLRNPSAGIAQEAYCSIALCLVFAVQLILAWRKGSLSRALGWIAAVLGLLLTIIMGSAYMTVLGEEAWSTWQTIPLFVIGDIAMGFALWGLMEAGAYDRMAFVVANAASQVAFIAVALLEVGNLATFSANVTLLYAAAAASLVAAVGAGAGWKVKSPALRAAVFAIALAAVAMARVAFYSLG